jgi:hypothetical protein
VIGQQNVVAQGKLEIIFFGYQMQQGNMAKALYAIIAFRSSHDDVCTRKIVDDQPKPTD